MRARLLTAPCLVHVSSQPFLRQPVTWWISRLHVKRTYFAGKPASGNLHRTSPTDAPFACTVQTCAASVSGSPSGIGPPSPLAYCTSFGRAHSYMSHVRTHM